MLTVLASKGGGEHPLSKARVKLLKPQAWQMVGTVDVREAPPASGRGLLPCSEESWGPSQLPRPSCDALTPACLRGRKEVRRAPAAFPFLPCSRLLAPSLLQAPGSFPVSASEEGRQHHGPPRGRHPPDLLLLQRSHRHHCPGHLPCGECAGGPGHCVCVCACVRVRVAPIYGDPSNGRTVAHHLLLEPWTSPFPAPGLGLPLCPKRGRGPCSSGRSGRRGPCSKQTYLTFSLRLSFCLCEMGPLAATSSSRYKRREQQM